MLPREGRSYKHFRVRLKSDYSMPQTLPLLGRHSGTGMPVKLLETEIALMGATVFAEVNEGAVRPAKVRVRTTVRTKVVFMRISWKRPKVANLYCSGGLPDGYNLRGMLHLSPLD